MQPGAYDVERTVFSGRFAANLTRPGGMSVPDQRAIVDRLVAYFGVEPISTERRRGQLNYNSHAHYETRVVTMGPLASPLIPNCSFSSSEGLAMSKPKSRTLRKIGSAFIALL